MHTPFFKGIENLITFKNIGLNDDSESLMVKQMKAPIIASSVLNISASETP